MKIVTGILLLAFGFTTAQADVTPLRKLSAAEQKERTTGDLKVVTIYRAGLLAVTAFVAQQTNLFPATKENVLPRREDKEILWQTWMSYLDYMLALDALDHFHRDWLQLPGEQRKQSFDVSHAAFLAKYRAALEFIAAIEKNPVLDTILNEPVPELGLPAGTYAQLKFRFLNVAIATDFSAQAALYPAMSSAASKELQQAIADDTTAIWKAGRGKGELLTAKNALKILQNAGSTAWFPVQAGVSEWMGDTKVYRKGRSLVSMEQIAELKTNLQPGDVLLVRREWFLSNIGLPGFWPHAALYIGTPEERQKFFSTPAMAAWVKARGITNGDFEQLIQNRSATNYAESLKPQEHEHQTRVIEAMSEGVSFTALEHCAYGDSVVVLRPLLPKTEKAEAILRAFHYAGRPYDFNFDFATDSELVCTELVFKSYEPAQDMQGLHLPLTEMLGRELLPANLIARQFDAQYGTPDAQFEFVEFLDGYERGGKAVTSSADEFRKSWQRPKWHVITQSAPK
jgi:hypothetical protein